jgi:hypothetical protein
MSRAIQADEQRDIDWRNRLSIILKEAATELLNAPELDHNVEKSS